MAVTAVRLPLRQICPVIFVLCVCGCVRREGRNSDCKWPAETAAHQATPRHLSEDAEFAEDLAIRYADVHQGLRTPFYVSGEDYTANRDRCMASLFEAAAAEHNIPVEQVRASLGQNRAHIDLAINIPFALLYSFLAYAAVRLVFRRYPPAENGWFPGAIMILFLSFAFAVGSLLVGDLWARIAETNRIGNPHISFRADRLIWARHQLALSLSAFFLFLAAATAAARRSARSSPEHADVIGQPSLNRSSYL